MKINKSELRRIISEEINRFIIEQETGTQAAGSDKDVQLSQQAKRDTQQTATNIKASNAQTLAQLQQFKDQNPNLDHVQTDKAITQLQQVGTEINASLTGAISESDSEKEISEIIRKLASGDYRVYSKKKNKKTGERRNLGTYSSKSAAKDREQDINFFKTLK